MRGATVRSHSSPSPMRDKPTIARTNAPTLFEQWVGSLTCHRIYMFQGAEAGPMVYHPNLRRLESLTICSFITKATLSPQFQGLNQWPYARQARA